MLTLPNLDCDVTSVCQLSCINCNRGVNPYRHSGQPIPQTTPQQVEHDLFHFGKIAHAKRWAAVGGEPLLHKDLVDILHVVRASGAVDEISVWTNGIAVQKMPPEFWRAFDTLVTSIYPGKVDDAGVAWIEAKCKDEGVKLELKDERAYPNWTRILEPAPTDPVYTKQKYDRCWYRTYCRALNFGYLFQCCTSGHWPQLLQGRPFGSDGVPIEGLTEQGMHDYLYRKEPLGSCTICCGRNTPSAVAVPWGEERNPVIWLERSSGR